MTWRGRRAGAFTNALNPPQRPALFRLVLPVPPARPPRQRPSPPRLQVPGRRRHHHVGPGALQVIHRRPQGPHPARPSRQQVLLVATTIRPEHDLVGLAGPVVGDGEEVRQRAERQLFTFLHGDVLLDHGHPVCLRAGGRPVVEFRHPLRLQALVLELSGHDHGPFDVVRPRAGPGLHRVARGALQRPPEARRHVLRDGFQIGMGLEAEDEVDARVVVPAVQVSGLRELRVATPQGPVKAPAEARAQGPVHLSGGPLG